ncbi:MAG: BatD family protein [Thiohalomonadales bacterium]
MVRSKLILWPILMVCLVAHDLYAANINVQLDRSIVQMDESFTLMFSSTESVDDDPDFSPLEKNFSILNRNQSSSFRIINGSISRETSWTLSLMPKISGNLTIPPINFGADSSISIPIVVQKNIAISGSGVKQAIYMEVEVEPKNAYVQAQIIYTVRIFHSVNLMDASLGELKLSDGDTIVEPLGNNASYDKQIDGRHYKVFEKKYALFPQKSGSITIAPLVFETRYVGNRRNLKHRRLLSKELVVKVSQKPSYLKGKTLPYWLPASAVEISDKWGNGNPVFKVGEPVTRTLRVSAEGLPASLLPSLHPDELTFAKLYPDQPVLKDNKTSTGVQGVREDKVAIIPTRSGDFIFPEIRVPWWNTQKNRWEQVIVKAKSISVKASATDTGQPTPILLESNIADASEKKSIAIDAIVKEDDSQYGEQFWFALSMLFLYLWLLTIVAWWYYANKAKKKSSASNDHRENSASMTHNNRAAIEKRLSHACDSGDRDIAKSLLIEWAVVVFPEKSPHSLTALAKRCGGTLSDEITYLNKLFYTNSDSVWQGDTLLRLIKAYSVKGKTNKQSVEMTPMYYHVSE